MRSIRYNNKGLSVITGFALILMTLSAMYVIYQVYAIPKICENAEVRGFEKTVNDLLSFSKGVLRITLNGQPSSFTIHLGNTYPEVPFFNTPDYYVGTISTYSGEVKIENAVAVYPSNISSVWNGAPKLWDCENLVYIPKTLYSDLGKVYWEYGVVAIGSNQFSYMGGTLPIIGNEIILPMLKGNLSYCGLAYTGVLHDYSGGGFIEITDNGNPIKIYLKTELPLSFWQSVLGSNPYVTDLNETNGTLVITLAQGVTYKLALGVASFENGKAPAHYLVPISSKVLTTPAEITVQVRDEYNNPLEGAIVTFASINGAVTLTNGTATGTVLTVKSNAFGYASVVAESGSGTVIASIVRPDGSTYQIAFIII